MNEFTCLACGGKTSRPWHVACRDFYLGIGTPVDYVACTGCGLVQQFPVPEDVSALYAGYPVHARRSRLQQLARRWLQHQVYYKPGDASGGQILFDYGCGDGVYLREVRGRFQSVAGYEPGSTLAAAISRDGGFPVYSERAEVEQALGGRVDVVTAHYVMEHVTDLPGTIALFARLLKPGGRAHIAVPNIRSWESRLFKRYWHGLDAPRHISFPDAGTFRRLGAAYGLTLVSARTATFPNTLAASLCTALTGRYHSGLFNLFILPSWLVALVFSSGTEVFVLEKKREG